MTRINKINKTRPAIFCVALLLVAACGVEEGVDQTVTPTTPAWSNKTPRLMMTSPGALAVGEKLTILGQDFIDPQHGYPMVVLKGTYYDGQG